MDSMRLPKTHESRVELSGKHVSILVERENNEYMMLTLILHVAHGERMRGGRCYQVEAPERQSNVRQLRRLKVSAVYWEKRRVVSCS